MQKFFLCAFFSFILFSLNAAAENNLVQITGGNFHIISGLTEQLQNARIETPDFTAISFIGGTNTPWHFVCYNINECRFGENFIVPDRPELHLGDCIGDCDQFVSGPFTMKGITYQKAYYSGNLIFSRETFSIPRVIKRKGKMFFKKPFTVIGKLQVCQETIIYTDCPADKILYDSDISGKGTLTVTAEIRVWQDGDSNPPYLFAKSFDYQFEK